MARNSAQIEKQRADIATLVLEGHSQRQIAAKMGIGKGTVQRDIVAIYATWRREMLTDLTDYIAREEARINKIEQEAWRAWYRSMEPKKSMDQRVIAIQGRTEDFAVGPAGELMRKLTPEKPHPLRIDKREKTIERDPQHRFMETIQWCVETRIKLRGLDKHNPIQTRDAARTIAEALRQAAKEAPFEVWDKELGPAET